MLEPLSLRCDFPPLPPDIQRLADDAADVALAFHTDSGKPLIPLFEPSSARMAYGHLKAVREQIAPGATLCEFGSGLGLVSCIAASLGWRVTGLEIEPSLLTAARGLAVRHGFEVSYCDASYKPEGFRQGTVQHDGLVTKHGFGLLDFDAIYIFAWPGEVAAVTRMFEAYAAPGTLLLLYEGGEAFSVLRATGRCDAV